MDAVEAALLKLAEFPGMGSPRSDLSKFKDLRIWPIPRFRNHLIYYRPIPGGIEVVRILYAAREAEPLLDE